MLDSSEAERLAAARAGNHDSFASLTEPYRRELHVHCYRILGSLHEAEDMVQETFLRAWRRLDTFAGRAPFRAWLYKIATNACLDALDRLPRRALPNATHPAADPHAPLVPSITELVWLEPFPDDWLTEAASSPEARYTAHESISLAFLAALQNLPPRQRAVLILSDVLDWRANEVAELLELTVSAVNSALHRARVTLAQRYHGREHEQWAASPDEQTRALLHRYVSAWENADVVGLVALLKEEAVLMMPPSSAWYAGRAAVGEFVAATIFAAASPMFSGEARGRWRLLPTRANGQFAWAIYQRDDAAQPTTYRAFGLQVVTLAHAHMAEITVFIRPEVVARFGLPLELKD